MFKKIILLLFISSFVLSGFAQKNKRKATAPQPKSSSFVMLINGDTIPAARYCPYDTIVFDFAVKDTSIKDFTFKWREPFTYGAGSDSTTPIKLVFPLPETNFTVSLTFYAPPNDTIIEVLTAEIKVDYIRTSLDTTVCEGRDITVFNSFGVPLTYTEVHGNIITPWDTLSSVSGCDSLVRWEITMTPYITLEYEISSCDSVIWGDLVIKRPLKTEGDTTITVSRFFPANDPDSSCDTLKILKVTIIDTAKLNILKFDTTAFCTNDDPMGFITLETNFTAFNWIFNKDKYRVPERDTAFTWFEPELPIEYSGHYFVQGYMDTSLYDTLKDLRIVNCSSAIKYLLVPDCPLIIPNVITPNDDGRNDVLGIKKLNPERENELVIYDRWGKNVWSQKNYKCVFKASAYHNEEDAFKGLARGGRKLPDGTYYYAFIYDAIPKKIRYTGTLVILR